VVKRIDAEDKTAGGIIIPDSAKEKPSQGEITAVGPGGRDEAGKLIPIDPQGRRPRGVRQVVGHRGQARRSGTSDHEGKRHHGRSHRRSRRQEEGRLSALARSLILRRPAQPASRRKRPAIQNLIPQESAQSRGPWDLRIRRSLCQPRKSNSALMPAYRMLRGVEILNNAVKVTHRSEGPQTSCSTSRSARPRINQGRRHCRQGNRARRPSSRTMALRWCVKWPPRRSTRPRRHYHRDRAGCGDRCAKAPRRLPPA